jgi:hypothetical protein
MRFGEINNADGESTRLNSSAYPALQVYNLAQSFGVGVQGRSPNRSGVGVEGIARGFSAPGGDNGIGVRGIGLESGVSGAGNIGVDGSGDGDGIDTGVRAVGESGVIGISRDGSPSNTAGVWGQGLQVNGNGVIGEANNGAYAYGVWGKSTSGAAGFFDGRVEVTGNLTKGGGGFKIDHPLDPEHKYLFHSFVEAPEPMNVYSGNVTTDEDGNVEVALPDYCEALNQDFRYQLTVIGELAQAVVAEEIIGNQFKVRTDRPNIKVSWQVTGIRRDAFTNMYRMPIEEDKPDEELGTYLHPEAFEQAETRGADYARRAELRSRLEKVLDIKPPAIEKEGEDSSSETE